MLTLQSQLGFHDSELAIVLEDQDFIDSKMDGKPYQAGRLAATLRRQLWREHLGLLPTQEYNAAKEQNAEPPNVSLNKVLEGPENDFVADPLGDEVWETWTDQATTNTKLYRLLFRADPDNDIKTFEDYDHFRPHRGREGHLFDMYLPAKDVRAKLDQIKGHLVWMPLDFLNDAEMAEPGLQVNQWTEVSCIHRLHSSKRTRTNEAEYLHVNHGHPEEIGIYCVYTRQSLPSTEKQIVY